MAWRFRRSKTIGPVRTTISKKGIGSSIGVPGFRVGVSPDGRKFWSVGIPGTGLYYIRYYR
jgi:hypothetical protein